VALAGCGARPLVSNPIVGPSLDAGTDLSHGTATDLASSQTTDLATPDQASGLTLLAGQIGVSGHADGIGAAAIFGQPQGIASDGAGNVYVVDNSMIRQIVIATGAVTTLAGTAGTEGSGSIDGTGAAAHLNGPVGIASDRAGNLYVTDSSAIRQVVIATGA
jgi:hypothetical protein